MTTIAWDGVTLAGDRRISVSNAMFTITKVRRTPDGRLLGGAGSSAVCHLMAEWLRDPPTARGIRPAAQDSADDWTQMLEISLDGGILLHVRHGAVPIRADFIAIGSGSEFATAAMALGKNAREAVELAARFDNDTGDGVDELRLREFFHRAHQQTA